jgi:enoyl-CoA hydratase/carnithine racemase
MSEADLLTNIEGPLLEVVLNRASKYNALNLPMLDGLQAAVDRFEADPALRVLLIRAEGRYFSSGMDVTTLEGSQPGEGPSGFRARYRRSARHDLWDAFERIEKPVVVAHQGVCLGAGLEMSLSCDFRLAAEGAAYGLPELDMGMIPGSGGTSRLVRTVGAHWARWLIMGRQRVSAQEAFTMGLVHQVWPTEDFQARVLAFCAELAAQPPEAMAAAKLAIEMTKDLDRTHARNLERLVNSSLSGGEEQERVFAALRARFDKPKG